MWRVLCALAALNLGILANVSDAAMFERDWKTPGDGLLTFDNVNQREWLDLSQTLLSDQFAGATTTERYQSVLGELAPGGLFEEFTYANRADVIGLAQSAGINTSTQSNATNAVPTTALGQLLGFTVPSSLVSVGLIDEFQRPQNSVPSSAMFWTLSNQAGLLIGVFDSQIQLGAPPAVLLYRTAPEPATFMPLVISVVVSSARLRGGVR
jgi:hypothetical protein